LEVSRSSNLTYKCGFNACHRLVFSLTPIQRIANEKLSQAVAQTEQERDRKGLFEFGAPRTSQFIRDAIKESEEQRNK